MFPIIVVLNLTHADSCKQKGVLVYEASRLQHFGCIVDSSLNSRRLLEEGVAEAR